MNRYSRMVSGSDSSPAPNEQPKQEESKQPDTASLHQSNKALSNAVMQQAISGEVLSPIDDAVIAVLRRAVMEVGDKPHSCRFTPAEKRALKDIIYEVEKDGHKCDANRVIRLALEYMMLDFKTNGKNGILYRFLGSLNY